MTLNASATPRGLIATGPLGCTHMVSGFDVCGLRCFPALSDPRTYTFVPRHPSLRRDATHQPLLAMVELGMSGYLMFSALWTASDAELDEARQELAARTAVDGRVGIRLTPAPVVGTRCHALLGDGHGTFQTVATSTTSGFSPYDAVFNIALQGERLSCARAGLQGDTGFLAIEYLADLPTPVVAGARFSARAEELAPLVHAPQHHATDLTVRLEQAVTSGRASVVVDVSDAHPAALTADLHARVLARAAEVLPRWLDEHPSGDIRVDVTLEQELNQPVRAFADIGAIVSAARPS